MTGVPRACAVRLFAQRRAHVLSENTIPMRNESPANSASGGRNGYKEPQDHDILWTYVEHQGAYRIIGSDTGLYRLRPFFRQQRNLLRHC